MVCRLFLLEGVDRRLVEGICARWLLDDDQKTVAEGPWGRSLGSIFSSSVSVRGPIVPEDDRSILS